MPKRDFRIDLAVGEAYLTADKEQAQAIQICTLVLISEEHGLLWQSETAYPLNEWVLDQLADAATKLEHVARTHWPALAGATDWWIPDTETYRTMYGKSFTGQDHQL